MNVKSGFQLIKDTFKEWREDNASRLAAALAYYVTFSLAPLLVLVIAIAGFFFGEAAVRGELVNQIAGLVGADAAGLIEEMIANASQGNAGVIATIVGLATLLIGATGAFIQLQDALNTVWEVVPDPDRPILSTLKDRVLSFGMILGIGFLLLVSFVISALISVLDQYVSTLLPASALILQVINFVVSFGVITLLFALIYRVLPDAEIAWSDVWIGAAMTALLFIVGKFAVGLYIGQSSVGSTYGAAGSLAVLLIWIYYSAQIVLFGAEFTQVYANRHGSRIMPSEDAIAMDGRAPAGSDSRSPEQQGA